MAQYKSPNNVLSFNIFKNPQLASKTLIIRTQELGFEISLNKTTTNHSIQIIHSQKITESVRTRSKSFESVRTRATRSTRFDSVKKNWAAIRLDFLINQSNQQALSLK